MQAEGLSRVCGYLLNDALNHFSGLSLITNHRLVCINPTGLHLVTQSRILNLNLRYGFVIFFCLSRMPGLLTGGQHDVLLIQHQAQAPAGELGATGTLLQVPLATFTAAGGVVVVLAANNGTLEMADLLTNAGMLQTTGFTEVTNEALTNSAPGDAIGINVPSPFLAKKTTASLSTPETESSSLTFVVTADSGDPVVIHRLQ